MILGIPEDIHILPPWVAIGDPALSEIRAKALTDRLRHDVPHGHPLFGRGITAVAARMDCDDVLFEVDDPVSSLAVVHLTWRRETDPRWPRTTMYKDWREWAAEAMRPDDEDYVL